tara:strand:- start:134 stop:400 length:267 start_codon:yes stop_codon:yes gene_type:complete
MGFNIDMAKAKELHKDKIRLAREEKFKELDIEFQRAIETNDTSTQASVAAKKQALRDAPADSAISSASDTDALKAQWNTSILGDSPYS